MDDRRFGRLIRAVRQRKDLRQSDVARLAGVSQKTVSDIELGRVGRMKLAGVRQVAAALDMSVSLDAWGSFARGEGDRLLDRGHAGLVEAVVGVLRSSGWTTVPELTFNVFGDRGSIDVAAWHAGEEVVLLVEVKTSLNDLQATLGVLAKKVRVAPDVVSAQLGWRPRRVAKLLAVAGTKANRSVVKRHAATFDAAFPHRSRRARAWLRSPSGRLSAVWFLPTSAGGTAKPLVRSRVRCAKRGS